MKEAASWRDQKKSPDEGLGDAIGGLSIDSKRFFLFDCLLLRF